MNTRKPSRQAIAQKNLRLAGRCVCCSSPSPHRCLCDQCAIRQGTKKRHPTPDTWAQVNWHLPNKIIANQLDVSTRCVSNARQRLNRTKRHLWAEVDWSQPDHQIATLMGVAPSYVSKLRTKTNQ